MIKLLYRNGSSSIPVPILVCDVCGARIENATNASVIFTLSTDLPDLKKSQGSVTQENASQHILFAHTGSCEAEAELLLGIRRYEGYWYLPSFLGHLLINAEVTKESVFEILSEQKSSESDV